MLDPKQKEIWLNALRSGEYQQGTGSLFQPKENTHCCIGVFAHCMGYMYSEAGFSHEDNERDVYKILNYQIGDNETMKLWRMNDSQKKSFLEIADYIEQNL